MDFPDFVCQRFGIRTLFAPNQTNTHLEHTHPPTHTSDLREFCMPKHLNCLLNIFYSYHCFCYLCIKYLYGKVETKTADKSGPEPRTGDAILPLFCTVVIVLDPSPVISTFFCHRSVGLDFSLSQHKSEYCSIFVNVYLICFERLR